MLVNMLVNIWSTVTHLSDTYFSTPSERKKAGLDLLICEQLQLLTNNKQIWMINPVWRTPGTTEVLLRESYRTIRDAQESYLILLTPGFADIVQEVPLRLIERHLYQIHKRARVFDKRVISTSVGIPLGCPSKISEKIKEINKIVEHVSKDNQGFMANLKTISYEPWTGNGGRPCDLKQTADQIAETILNCHPLTDKWRELHGRR